MRVGAGIVFMWLACLIVTTNSDEENSGETAKGRPKLTLKDLNIQRLTTKGYLDTIVANDRLVVFYYIEEYHQMTDFVRAVDKACQVLKESHADFEHRYVHSSLDSSLIKPFNVAKVPIVRVFVQQVDVAFETPSDGLDFEGLPSFIDEILRNKSPVLKKSTELELWWNYSVFMFNANKTFLDNVIDLLAMRFRKTANVFAVDSTAAMDSIAKRLGVDIRASGFVLMVHHQHSQQALVFDGPIHPFSITKYLTEHTVGGATPLTQTVYEWAVREKMLVLAYFYRNPKYTRDRIEVIKQIAPHIQEKQVIVALADLNGDFAREFVTRHGLCDSFDCVVAFEPSEVGIPKYLFESATFSAQEILEFINEIHARAAPRFYKSQPIDDRMQGSLGVAVGRDFEQKVAANTAENALVFFFDKETECVDLASPAHRRLPQRS